MSDDDTKSATAYKMPLFWISDVTELNLLGVEDKMREKLAKIWSAPRMRSPQEGGANYRFINYLSTTGLLDDRRDTAGKGWRAFSFVEIVYINTVIALRKYGVKADSIKPIYKFFSTPYDKTKENHTYGGLMWLEAMIAVACGCEIELIVDSDGTVMLLDPQYMSIFGTGATKGTLRISLSTMVNQTRKQFGMNAIEMTSHFGKLPLDNSEVDTVLKMRNLNEHDTLKIRRLKKKQTLIDLEISVPRDDTIAEQLSSFLDEYGELTIAKEGGKVVSLKKSNKTIINN
jgi:hypothetical protein